MKILYLCADLGIPVLGGKGAAVHVRAMVSAFHRAGHEVTLAAPILNKSPWERPASLDGRLSHFPASDEIKEVALSLKTYDTLLGAHAPSLAGEVRRILYNQSLEKRLVRTFDSHPPDLIYERMSLYATAGVAVARTLGRPLFVELNAPLALEQETYRGSGIKDLAAQAERWTLTQANAVVVVSNALRDYVTGLGVPRERVHVMPNGVDPDLFRLRGPDSAVSPAAGRELPVVGFVGGLRPWHGVDSLPELMSRLKEARCEASLVVVGDGPLRKELQERLNDRGLDSKARLMGVVSHQEVPGLIQTFDVAVAPYPALEHSFYFSPLKLFEYLACGVPVVAPRLGQIDEIIQHGQTGLLYPAGDVPAMARACQTLLEDGGLRRRMGEQGARLVRERYTWDHNARRVLALAADARGHETRRSLA